MKQGKPKNEIPHKEYIKQVKEREWWEEARWRICLAEWRQIAQRGSQTEKTNKDNDKDLKYDW